MSPDPAHVYDRAAVHPRWGTFHYEDQGDGTIKIDPAWIATTIMVVETVAFGRIRCHTSVAAAFQGVDSTLEANGWLGLVDKSEFARNIAGVWVPRHQLHRVDRPLSLHSWGVAMDVNVAGNGYGKPSTQPPDLIKAFKANGFRWGGEFRNPDPMHWEAV